MCRGSAGVAWIDLLHTEAWHGTTTAINTLSLDSRAMELERRQGEKVICRMSFLNPNAQPPWNCKGKNPKP